MMRSLWRWVGNTHYSTIIFSLLFVGQGGNNGASMSTSVPASMSWNLHVIRGLHWLQCKIMIAVYSRTSVQEPFLQEHPLYKNHSVGSLYIVHLCYKCGILWYWCRCCPHSCVITPLNPPLQSIGTRCFNVLYCELNVIDGGSECCWC